MLYKVANSLDEVFEAWCIVYKQYLAASLISNNPFSIFTFPEYISSNSAVIVGKKMGHSVCTISGVLDSEKGLPLDRYYKPELDKLREENKNLIEIGLLADIRKRSSISTIVELMSGIARFGVYSDHVDYVIGVHPRRASFFNKIFGCRVIGDIKEYNKLNIAPVVLMFCSYKDMETVSLRANSEINSDPKDYKFHERYKFDSQNFVSSKLENFLRKIWNTSAYGKI